MKNPFAVLHTWNKAAASAVTEVGGKAVGQAARPLKFLKRPVKGGLIGAAVAAGLVGLGLLYSNIREKRSYDPVRNNGSDELDAMTNDLPPVQSFMPLVQQMQPTLMGQPLVAGQHAQRVIAARGGLGGGINASQPEISSPDGTQVQDLGTARV